MLTQTPDANDLDKNRLRQLAARLRDVGIRRRIRSTTR